MVYYRVSTDSNEGGSQTRSEGECGVFNVRYSKIKQP